jgi:hypothetical protein
VPDERDVAQALELREVDHVGGVGLEVHLGAREGDRVRIAAFLSSADGQPPARAPA